VREGADKRRLDGAEGFVGPPPDAKSQGTVRYRHSGEDSSDESKGREKPNTKDEPQKREVRPKTGKDKKNANDKENPGG